MGLRMQWRIEGTQSLRMNTRKSPVKTSTSPRLPFPLWSSVTRRSRCVLEGTHPGDGSTGAYTEQGELVEGCDAFQKSCMCIDISTIAATNTTAAAPRYIYMRAYCQDPSGSCTYEMSWTKSCIRKGTALSSVHHCALPAMHLSHLKTEKLAHAQICSCQSPASRM